VSAAASLVALIEGPAGRGGASVRLASPAVGILRGVPAPGHLLGPGEPFARLTILDRTHPLLVPEGVSGIVAEISVAGSGADAIPVEYAQPILALAPIDDGSAATSTVRPGASLRRAPGGAGGAAEAIPAGCHAILCPADGIFYRRPRPSEAPYVEIGDRVHAGRTLALIEAMKCFSAIVYGGAGVPDEAEIVEVRAADTSEVRHGQVLFVVR
jgi:acetyl-CoA carboxylase biotin carboxyl carrier protein